MYYQILAVWNQYDGILNPVPDKGWFQKLKSWTGLADYEKKLEKDLKLSVKAFFPKWKHFQDNGEENSTAEVMKSLNMLYQGLKKSYFRTCKQWKNTETEFRIAVGKV